MDHHPHDLFDLAQQCRSLLEACCLTHMVDFQVGLTRVYFGPGVIETLERQRHHILTRVISQLQTHVKRHLCRRRFLVMRHAAIFIETCVRGYLCRRAYHHMRYCIITCQALFRGFQDRAWVRRLRHLRAVVTVQALYRGHRQCRQYMRRIRPAVITIQSFWRFVYLRRMMQRHIVQIRARRALGSKVQLLQSQMSAAPPLELSQNLRQPSSSSPQKAHEKESPHLPRRFQDDEAMIMQNHDRVGATALHRVNEKYAILEESSVVLGSLHRENQSLRDRVIEMEREIHLLKEENRRTRETIQAKDVEDKVKQLSQKSAEVAQIAYVSLLEEEYEKVRLFLCSVFDLNPDLGSFVMTRPHTTKDGSSVYHIPTTTAAHMNSHNVARRSSRSNSLRKQSSGDQDGLIMNSASQTTDLTSLSPLLSNSPVKHEAYTLLTRSGARLSRLRSRDGKHSYHGKGSARHVKDYWDEIKTNHAPPLPYTLGSTPWKRLLTDWAQGNPKKLDYMTRWLQNVLDGGDIEHGPFPLGVELKSVTPMMLEGFIQLVIPKLAERPDIKVHVHTKEFIGTSMRIKLEMRDDMATARSPPRRPSSSSKDIDDPHEPRATRGSSGLETPMKMKEVSEDVSWGRHSVRSVREHSPVHSSMSSLRSTQTTHMTSSPSYHEGPLS